MKPDNTQETIYVGLDTGLPPYLPYPRFLLKMDISQTAKLLYALLLDRTTLSQRNGWQDNQGRTFIVYPIAEIAEMLDKGQTAIKAALNELDAAGLLERKRAGFSAANRLYVKLPPLVRISDPMTVGKATLISAENRPTDGRKSDLINTLWKSRPTSSRHRRSSTASGHSGLQPHRPGEGESYRLSATSEWIVSVGQHPGLIPAKTWIKVQESLERNKSKGYRKPRSNEALLTGLLWCRCGNRMYPKLSKRFTADGKPIYTYVCKMKERSKRSLCNRRNAHGNLLDAAIVEQVKSLASNDSTFLTQLEKSKRFTPATGRSTTNGWRTCVSSRPRPSARSTPWWTRWPTSATARQPSMYESVWKNSTPRTPNCRPASPSWRG